MRIVASSMASPRSQPSAGGRAQPMPHASGKRAVGGSSTTCRKALATPGAPRHSRLDPPRSVSGDASPCASVRRMSSTGG
eukprot:2109911-Prymnesium_polylepis.4